jgi:glycosyltransferase involved in cell wall biosynthesis
MADAVVVTYRSAESIGACLEPLLAAGLHVVVVDNAETADTVRALFPQVELIENAENRGFPAAVNQALACCTSDVVLLVNPDCVVPPATARALVERGHALAFQPPRRAGANAQAAGIAADGLREAACDPRYEGVPAVP